ncbi:MAG: ParA family protein [Desulfatibacillaceae bacterium]
MGRIISILNHKGGVGKTTLTVNLAHALSRLGHSVMVIDNSSQCNATNILLPQGEDAGLTLYNIFDARSERQAIGRFIYPTKYANVYCIPNHPDTGSLEARIFLSKSHAASLLLFKDLMRNYAIGQYDYTLIDNSPSLGAFVLCSLHMSDNVILPVKAGSGFSLDGVLNVVRVIRDLNAEHELQPLGTRIVVNQVDRRTAMSRYTFERIGQHLGRDILFRTAIPSNAVFERAEAVRESILKYKGSSPGARAFRDLAQEVQQAFPSQTGQEAVELESGTRAS